MPGFKKIKNISTISLLLLAFSGSALSDSLTATVTDDQGAAVENAVVSLMPATGPQSRAKDAPPIIIDQVNKEFVAYVTPIQVGTLVSFPNSDQIRHHVYSFSKVKSFEIPLYGRGSSNKVEVLFDKPGEVVVGCNIHDWMKAYIYVVETPYFAKTDNTGRATINKMSAGNYELNVWHPNIDKTAEKSVKQKVTVKGVQEVKITITTTQDWKRRRAPFGAGGGNNY